MHWALRHALGTDPLVGTRRLVLSWLFEISSIGENQYPAESGIGIWKKFCWKNMKLLTSLPTNDDKSKFSAFEIPNWNTPDEQITLFENPTIGRTQYLAESEISILEIDFCTSGQLGVLAIHWRHSCEKCISIENPMANFWIDSKKWFVIWHYKYDC